MGINCRIIRNTDNSVQTVEAPNGSPSLLYDEIKNLDVEESEALDLWVVSTTPTFLEQVVTPKINAHRNRIFNKLRGITPRNNDLTLIINNNEVPIKINELNYSLAETQDGITMFASTNIDGKSFDIGKIRLKPFNDGYIIRDANLSELQVYKGGNIETIRNNGIGTEMYKQIVDRLVAEGIPVYSTPTPTLEAQGVWKKFKNVGIVRSNETSRGVQYVIDPMPSSLDVNGEARLKDLMKFVSNSNNENVEAASEEMVLEVREALLSTNFNTSEDLLQEWDKVFFNNGTFEVTNSGLRRTSMYTQSEKQNILNNPELQQTIMDTYFVLKNSPVIENDLFVDENFLTIEGTDTNILGKYRTANPFVLEKEALEVLSGSQNRQEFEDNLMSSDLDYLKEVYLRNQGTENDIFFRFTGYTPVEEKQIVDGVLVDRINNSVEGLLSETLTDPSNTEFLEALIYLSDVNPTLWLNNPENIKTLLKDLSKKSIDIGLDLTGIEEIYDAKEQFEFAEFFDALDTFINNQNQENFNNLVNLYRDFFNIDESISTKNVKNVEGNVVYLDSQKTAFELFTNFGLLPVGKNLYRRVNNSRPVEDVYNLMYQNILSNPSLLPLKFYEGFALTRDGILDRSKINNPENQLEVIERMKNFVRIETNQIDSQGEVRDTDMLEKMYLYSAFFNTELNNVETIPDVSTEAFLVEQDIQNVEYLTGEFVADFYKQYLTEKLKNSELFRDFYSNFEVTEKGIKIINTDPITMDRLKLGIESRPNLKNHLLLQKDSPIFEELSDENFILNDETFLRNYYANFPRAVKKFTEEYSVIDNDTLVAKSPDNFIRTDQGLFEMSDSYGDFNVYKRIQENNSNYKSYSKNFTKPVNEIDLSGYGIFENNAATGKTVNNIYSKQQETNIDNQIDNCN